MKVSFYFSLSQSSIEVRLAKVEIVNPLVLLVCHLAFNNSLANFTWDRITVVSSSYSFQAYSGSEHCVVKVLASNRIKQYAERGTSSNPPNFVSSRNKIKS